jgi:hypothetical protein
MKKIMLVALLGLAACHKPILFEYKDAQTQFIVVDKLDREGMKDMSTYEVEVIDANNLVHNNCDGSGKNLFFWFSDSTGKYKIGQPIHFNK